jgi:hypothetical protein
VFRVASKPGSKSPGDDRAIIAAHVAAVLDGASSFDPDVPTAGDYVDELAANLANALECDRDLACILADAIDSTADALRLLPGSSPSSTVAMARVSPNVVELLALGDSTAVVGTRDGAVHRITDNRLDSIAQELRAAYHARLRAGAGYDDEHSRVLAEVQRAQREARNREGGYWIAEAAGVAARHAVTATFPRGSVQWIALATDGAQRVIDYLGQSWRDVARMGPAELADLLRDLHDWEERVDPSGKLLPRAKRHDDKLIVTCWL